MKLQLRLLLLQFRLRYLKLRLRNQVMLALSTQLTQTEAAKSAGKKMRAVPGAFFVPTAVNKADATSVPARARATASTVCLSSSASNSTILRRSVSTET